ncbi:MAG TPA: hypothetical protein VGP46_09265, partial [Acidimicrobiales bacterium]|nr:hypothetical protein [Acidimicrobiales bacterium]
PYQLTLYRLDPSTLRPASWRHLGRGYRLTLSADPESPQDILAATGGALLEVQAPSLATRVVASFTKAVVQHVAVESGSPDVAVSLLSPAEPGSAEDASIETIDLETGGLVATYNLPAAADPESIAFAGGRLWASVGQGLSTQVMRLSLPGLLLVAPGRPVTTGLETISLAVSGDVVWMYGLTFLECATAAGGREAASAVIKSPPAAAVLEVTSNGQQAYVVTEAGIGTVPIPSGCTA